MRDISFFDTAAALIPVLLLGGAITERFPRGENRRATPSTSHALGVFAFFFILPATAEMVAIAAALSDSPDRFSVWFVAFAVAFGTWALAASLTWPWIQSLFIGRFRTGFACMLVVLIGIFTWLLVESVDLESVRQDVEASRQVLEREEQRARDLLLEDDSSEDGPVFNVEMLRFVDAQEKHLDARLASGRISSRQAARERLGIARTRVFITRNMLLGGVGASPSREGARPSP